MRWDKVIKMDKLKIGFWLLAGGLWLAGIEVRGQIQLTIPAWLEHWARRLAQPPGRRP